VGAWEIYAYKVRWKWPARRRDLPRAAAAAFRSLGGDVWTIDAVTFHHHHTVHRWTTTTEYKGQVLAQVEGNLARGDIPIRLTNAVYRGELRR
jgi:hypothetical protein